MRMDSHKIGYMTALLVIAIASKVFVNTEPGIYFSLEGQVVPLALIFWGCFLKKGLTVDYCSWKVTLSKSQNIHFPNLNNKSWRHYNVIILIKTVFQPETKTRYEICLKLIIKTQERRQFCPSGVFTVNFEHSSQLVLVFLLLTLNRQMKRQKQWHNGKMGRSLHSKCFLVIDPDYHIQRKRWNYICNLTVIFTSLICIQSSELNSIAKPQAFLDLKILVLGASLSRNRFWLFQRTW